MERRDFLKLCAKSCALTAASVIVIDRSQAEAKNPCKMCIRENMKLFLRGDRCYTNKCPMEKRNHHQLQHDTFSEKGGI